MPNDKIYDQKETPMLEEIKDETVRNMLDELCDKFIMAESLKQLGELYAEAIKRLVESQNETNEPEIISAIAIMEAVHARVAVEIVLNDMPIADVTDDENPEQV